MSDYINLLIIRTTSKKEDKQGQGDIIEASHGARVKACDSVRQDVKVPPLNLILYFSSLPYYAGWDNMRDIA